MNATDLLSILPAPQHSYTISNNSSVINPLEAYQQSTAIEKLNSRIPLYGQRENYVPRDIEDFGDGGAFPEIHIKQYPLDMGRKETQFSFKGTVALQFDNEGNARYDAILREGMRKDQLLQSQYRDLLPKYNINDDDLQRPSEEQEKETTEETRLALEKVLETRLSSTRPRTQHKDMKLKEAIFIRYTPSNSNDNKEQYNSGAKSRMIKLYEMPVDPLEPPQFRHKKLPLRPPSPPVPVMHSPPRKITIEDQKNWKIPPCISNWKNNKGFTMPLHQRLAADGRALTNHTINDKFAKFAESLLIAERQARIAVKKRAEERMVQAKKRKTTKRKTIIGSSKKKLMTL